jgi:hypothetical protein
VDGNPRLFRQDPKGATAIMPATITAMETRFKSTHKYSISAGNARRKMSLIARF